MSNNEMTLFDFKGSQVRVVMKDAEPWFVAKDVTDVLGYSSGRQAVKDYVSPGHRADVSISDGRQNRQMTIIGEAGVYQLVLGAKIAGALMFREWVTAEVLPTIRKTEGAYIKPGSKAELDLTDPDTALAKLMEVAQTAREVIARNKELEAANERLQVEVQEGESYKQWASKWIEESNGELFTVRDTARRFQLRPSDLSAKLREWGWIEQYSTAAKAYAIGQQYMQNKVFFPYYPDMSNSTCTGKFTAKGLERLAIKLDAGD